MMVFVDRHTEMPFNSNEYIYIYIQMTTTVNLHVYDIAYEGRKLTLTRVLQSFL